MTVTSLLRFLWLVWLWMIPLVIPPDAFAYDGSNQATLAYDNAASERGLGYDSSHVFATGENKYAIIGDGVLFARCAGFLAAEETGAANTFYHYSQAEIPAGQGLTVNSGVTAVGDLNAQQAMLKLGIPPPKYVYPVNLENPLEHLTIDLGTPSRNTIPSWTVIKQTPPGSVGPRVVVPRGN